MPDTSVDLIGRCPNCQAAIRRGHSSTRCGNCGNTLPEALQAAARAGMPPASPAGPQVAFRRFSSSVQSWNALFAEAAEFATKVGRERLVNISHSADHSEGVVTVWYWSK